MAALSLGTIVVSISLSLESLQAQGDEATGIFAGVQASADEMATRWRRVLR